MNLKIEQFHILFASNPIHHHVFLPLPIFEFPSNALDDFDDPDHRWSNLFEKEMGKKGALDWNHFTRILHESFPFKPSLIGLGTRIQAL